MPDPAISAFLHGQREAWVQKNLKPTMKGEAINKIHQEADRLFSLQAWLKNAMALASKRTLTTHPSKFSNPALGAGKTNLIKNTYVSPLIARSTHRIDGYLRTGNVTPFEIDSIGNGNNVGSAGHVGRFLSLTLSDGRRLYEHFIENSDIALRITKEGKVDYSEAKKSFLSMLENQSEEVTNSKIKQVFFPVNENYHLLSLLPNSGIMYELKKRLKPKENIKELRDKKRHNEYSEERFSEIYRITTIGFGGTQANNISYLNNDNAGKAYLLVSTPPELTPRNIRYPKTDFFRETLYFKKCTKALEGLHRIFTTGVNSDIPRKNLLKGRDNRIDEILTYVLEQAWQVRSLSTQVSDTHISNLSSAQKIWLIDLPDYLNKRHEETDWLTTIVDNITGWVLSSYKKHLGKEAVLLDQAERDWLHELIENHREALL